jgi:HSP20 family molecular chaperone IbpA
MSHRGCRIRGPLVNVYEEDNSVSVLVERSGVAKKKVELKGAEGRRSLLADRGKTSCRKEVDLPEGCSAERWSWGCSNGVLQARFDW